MDLCSKLHIAEDILDKCSMFRLTDLECAQVEEHLLVCQMCRQRVQDTDEYIAIMKAALVATEQVHTLSRRIT